MKKDIWGFIIFSFVAVILSQFAISEASAYTAAFNKTQIHRDGECMTLTWSEFGDRTRILIYKGNTFWVSANNDAPDAGSQQICVDSSWEYGTDYKIRVELKSNPTIYVYANSGSAFSVVGYPNQMIDFTINNNDLSTSQQSVNLQFSFTSGPERPAPTQYMASGNNSFSGASWQSYSTNVVPFTLSAGAGAKEVFIKVKNLWGESNWKWDNIMYAPILYYAISGTVKNEAGQGISGVTLNGFPSGNATTNVNGAYNETQIISTWSGTITPTMSGYTFTPTSKTFNGLSGDTIQNFTATANVSYAWYTGPYGQCSDSCSGGKRTRVVECRNSGGQTVADSNCTGTKPGTVLFDCPSNPYINESLGTEQYVAP